MNAVTMNTRKAYGKALLELGEKYENVVVLDADLSGSTNTANFGKKFPERFFNVGIAEQNMMAMAAGFATTGKRSYASTFAIFATGRVYDQIRQSIAYPGLNVKIVATHGGVTVGGDGASHQMLEDISLMRTLPNMTVIVPSDYYETESVIKASALYDGPMYIRLGRADIPVINKEGEEFHIGKAKIVNEGTDVTIIATGIMVSRAMTAVEMLKEEGISAELINMASIKPIDVDAIIKSARKTGCVVTAEEHNIIGGLGSAVSEVITSNYPVPVARVGVNDMFGRSGEAFELMEYYGLTPESIVKKAYLSIDMKEKECYEDKVHIEKELRRE